MFLNGGDFHLVSNSFTRKAQACISPGYRGGFDDLGPSGYLGDSWTIGRAGSLVTELSNRVIGKYPWNLQSL